MIFAAPVPPVLIVPIAGETPALRLLYSYMARVAAVKKSALRWQAPAGAHG